MQLFHTHIQSLPILRTFHDTNIQRSNIDTAIDSPKKNPDVTPDAIKAKEDQEKSATEIAKNTQPDTTGAKQDLDYAMNGAFLGGKLDPNAISKIQAQIKKENTVEGADRSGSGSSIPSLSSEEVNLIVENYAKKAGEEMASPKFQQAMGETKERVEEFKRQYPEDFKKLTDIWKPITEKFSRTELQQIGKLQQEGHHDLVDKEFPTFKQLAKECKETEIKFAMTNKPYAQFLSDTSRTAEKITQ